MLGMWDCFFFVLLSVWAWNCLCSGWQKKLLGLIDAPGTFQPRARGHISPHTGRDLAQRRSAEMPLMGSDHYGWDNTGYECPQPGLLLVLWINSKASFTSVSLKTLEKFEADVARLLNHPLQFFFLKKLFIFSERTRNQKTYSNLICHCPSEKRQPFRYELGVSSLCGPVYLLNLHKQSYYFIFRI